MWHISNSSACLNFGPKPKQKKTKYITFHCRRVECHQVLVRRAHQLTKIWLIVNQWFKNQTSNWTYVFLLFHNPNHFQNEVFFSILCLNTKKSIQLPQFFISLFISKKKTLLYFPSTQIDFLIEWLGSVRKSNSAIKTTTQNRSHIFSKLNLQELREHVFIKTH